MNFQIVFLAALCLVVGGNALHFDPEEVARNPRRAEARFVAHMNEQKNLAKQRENAGVDLLTVDCSTELTAIFDTMTNQGCFNTSWNESSTIFHDQLVTMCANCDGTAAYNSLILLPNSCLETLPTLVYFAAKKAADCVTSSAGVALCAEPLLYEFGEGQENKTQALLETVCTAGCFEEWYAEMVAKSATCSPLVDYQFLYCLTDAGFYCAEYLNNEKWDDWMDFCDSPCAGKFYDTWDPIYVAKTECYANQSSAIDGELFCRENSAGANCMNVIENYPSPATACNTAMGTTGVAEWSYCNGTCKTGMQTMFTDLGCCAHTFVRQQFGEKDAIIAADWLLNTCSITDTACSLVYTASTPISTTDSSNGGGGGGSDDQCALDNCETEINACLAIDDCVIMVNGCHDEDNGTKFKICSDALGYNYSSTGLQEAGAQMECTNCKCGDQICGEYSALAEPEPEPESTSGASKVSIAAVMFIAMASTLKFL